MNIERKEQHIQEDTPSLGLLLKQARLDLGMTDEEVAARLKLRVSVVREIEAMHGEQGQITTFTRGYIRSYAKLVGLDVDYLLNSNHEACQVEPVEHQLQSFSKKARDEQLDNRVMVLTWFIFAVVLGITMFWWWQNQQQNQLMDSNDNILLNRSGIPEESIDPDTGRIVFTEDEDRLTDADVVLDENTEKNRSITLVNVTPAEPIEGEREQTVLSDSSSVSNPIQSQPSVKTLPPEKTETVITEAREDLSASAVKPVQVIEKEEKNPVVIKEKPTIPVDLSSKLRMSFSADCWVDIRDANGKRMLTGIKSAGEKIELSGKVPYKVVIGAPTAVTITFEGEQVDLTGYSPKQVARFSLPN